MSPSGVGEKRPRDTQVPFDFIPGLKLSQHPFKQRKGLFIKKLEGINTCKSLHPTQFEGYTIRERFKRMGWERLLSFDCDKIYRRVVIQWMASLSKTGDELTGVVDGKSYTITPRIIQDLLGVDTRTDLPYTRFKEMDLEVDFQADTAENKFRWTEAFKTVFGGKKYAKKEKQGYEVSKMTPLAKILLGIAESTFLPCSVGHFQRIYPHEIHFLTGSINPHSVGHFQSTFISDFPNMWINPYEIHLLHALLTGDYLYSFAHLMIDDIWDMYEQEYRMYIPYGYYISEILCRLGAVAEDEYIGVIPPEYRVISVGSFPFLKFSRSPTEYIIDDQKTRQRITFPKEGTREAPPQPQPVNQLSQTYQHMSPQTSVPNQNVEMTNLFTKFQNLIDKQSSIFQKQYDEVKMVVTYIQKQMERQALEAERREQAREKLAVKREKRAEERERQAEEREKQAEIRAKEREKRAEEREKWAKERERQADKREKRAEMWTHAIIWDIERQRYFYEMEQEQLRMAWNQPNGANADDEFQLPPMPRTSLHPPQEGSPYYDPTQGDEIPKAFQPLYQDIYGPRRKKPSSR